jgi:hypothetical protein
MSDVSDLRMPATQAVLARHHYSQTPPYCACGLGTGERKYLTVYQLPWATRAGELSLRRKLQEEHNRDCWLNLSEDGQDHELVYSSSMFRLLVPGEASVDLLDRSSPLAPSKRCRREQFRFGRFASHVFAEAQIDALVSVNRDWRRHGFRPVPCTELFRQIDHQLQLSPFAEGSAYAAACTQDCALRFGVIPTNAEMCDFSSDMRLNVQWWSRDTMCFQTVVVLADMWNVALGSIQACGRLLTAPYLCFAAIDREGRVRRLRLFSCHCDGITLAPSESGYETGFSGHLAGLQQCAFKPVLRSDTVQLFERLQLFSEYLVPKVRWRPDYLVLIKRGNTWRCYVIELRGFKKGQIPAYDLHLDEKKAYFSSLDPRVCYVERNGWDYRLLNTEPSDINWRDLRLGWWGKSPAAANWQEGNNV